MHIGRVRSRGLVILVEAYASFLQKFKQRELHVTDRQHTRTYDLVLTYTVYSNTHSMYRYT